MIWAILQVGGRQLASLLAFAVLGILLPPRDFGLVGMALAWLAIVQSLSDLGLGAALVQRREIGSAHFSTVFILNVAVGLLLAVTGVALSWPSAWLFDEPALQPVAAALSLNFLLASFSAAQTAVAQRELRFRELAVRDIAASLTGGVTGVVLALSGAGVWSLVAQSLTGTLVSAALIWPMSAWRPRLGEYSTALLREMWPYSRHLFVFSVFKSLAQNFDRILLGHLLGPAAVGLYVFSFRLVVQPVSTLVGAIGTYLFPFLSRLQADGDALRRAYGNAMSGLAAVTLPIAVLAGAGASALVPVLWGPKWAEAVPLMQIMALLAVIQAYVSPVGQLFKSLDRPRWLLWWSVGITAAVAVLLTVGVKLDGVRGAAWGITAAYALGTLVIVRATTVLIHFGMHELWRTCGKPVAAAAAMAGVVFLVDHLQAQPSWGKTAAITLVPLGAYCWVLFTLDQSLFATVATQLRSRR